MSASALGRIDHPLRAVLGSRVASQLIRRLDEPLSQRRIVRFPEAVESEFLRECGQRRGAIRRMILDGCSVRETAQAAKVHSRTVGYHRARLRAEGLLAANGAPTGRDQPEAKA